MEADDEFLPGKAGTVEKNRKLLKLEISTEQWLAGARRDGAPTCSRSMMGGV